MMQKPWVLNLACPRIDGKFALVGTMKDMPKDTADGFQELSYVPVGSLNPFKPVRVIIPKGTLRQVDGEFNPPDGTPVYYFISANNYSGRTFFNWLTNSDISTLLNEKTNEIKTLNSIVAAGKAHIRERDMGLKEIVKNAAEFDIAASQRRSIGASRRFLPPRRPWSEEEEGDML